MQKGVVNIEDQDDPEMLLTEEEYLAGVARAKYIGLEIEGQYPWP